MNADAANFLKPIVRALSHGPLIWKENGWYYRARRFAPSAVRNVVNSGDAVQIGNFVVRSIKDIGQPGMMAKHQSFESLTAAGKTLLRRAVIKGELTIEKFIGGDGNVAPYELVIGGFAIISGFTIKPNEVARLTVMSHAWRDLTDQQREIIIELRRSGASLSRKAHRADTLASLIENELLSPEELKITDFGTAVVDRYGKES